jgi:NAD+ synthase (glutamine-hydrolysing)
MKIALAQTNTTVGDLCGNTQKILSFAQRAAAAGAEVVAFPELTLTGYPPRDLLEKQTFLDRVEQHLETLAADAAPLGVTLIVGTVTRRSESSGRPIYNSAAVVKGGRVAFRQHKMLLPSYDVFDETRYFEPAPKQFPLTLDGSTTALTICEDAWNDKHFWHKRMYGFDPVEALVRAGGNFVLNISASPFWLGKRELRRDMLATIARTDKVPVVMVNQVGGNDSLLFDGSSLVLNREGKVIAQGKSFEEDIVYFDSATLEGELHEQVEGEEASAYAALVLGTRDYVRKCSFKQVIIGLSGGIDSALTAAIATDAMGPENVIGVGMPGPYSSPGSIEDARSLANNLGIRFELLSITEICKSYQNVLKDVFAGLKEDVTEENIQSRARGSLLMALSNKLNGIVLSTGNKSEIAVGYCTLYGDMVGGLAVISDVPKTLVYRISRYLNSRRPVIPEASLEKPPSAELRPDQRDSDTLPPYDILDAILEDYVEDSHSAAQIAKDRGLDLTLVQRVIRMVDRAEYKRQQAAPGIKISAKAFGYGRRFPIAAKSEA